MVPATHSAVLALLIASFVCLAIWVNVFKRVAAKYRFELFSLDFAIGALVLAVVACYTMGTMGTDLGFGDRILVAGRTQQALAVIAGGVFGLGIMLLFASISVLGIATAFPFVIGVAMIVNSGFHFHAANAPYLAGGILLTLVALFFELRAAGLREAALEAARVTAAAPVVAQPAPTAGPRRTGSASVAAPVTEAKNHVLRPGRKRKNRLAVRGIVAALIAGVPLGVFVPILQNCLPGDLGLQAYAGMLLFGIGLFLSTIVYDFYFLNMPVEGPSLTFATYFRGSVRQHVAGFLTGLLVMAGLLSAAVALLSPAITDVSAALHVVYPLLCVPLATVFGLTVWKELNLPGGAKMAALAGLLLFLCGLGLFSQAFTH